LDRRLFIPDIIRFDIIFIQEEVAFSVMSDLVGKQEFVRETAGNPEITAEINTADLDKLN
jgi:hypothetical protein